MGRANQAKRKFPKAYKGVLHNFLEHPHRGGQYGESGSLRSLPTGGNRIAVLAKCDEGGYLPTVAPDGSDCRVLVKADQDGDPELSDD